MRTSFLACSKDCIVRTNLKAAASAWRSYNELSSATADGFGRMQKSVEARTFASPWQRKQIHERMERGRNIAGRGQSPGPGTGHARVEQEQPGKSHPGGSRRGRGDGLHLLRRPVYGSQNR